MREPTLLTRPNQSLEQQRLGDFVIGHEIGRGGMGVVYEARQASLNRRVALKVLSSTIGLTPQAVQRFHREAEAAAKLHHTNIVPIYATGEDNGAHFYAMELIEGPSLEQVIRQLRDPQTEKLTSQTAADGRNATPPPLESTGPFVESTSTSSSSSGLSSSSLTSGTGYFDTAARMIAEVADALNYAHGQGVIHRDVKPANLLLSPAGRLSVNDFGLARMLEQPGMTITGEMVGTPRYMSPEQITAGRVLVDHRTDIYSLGATLYELLTMQPPFLAEHRDQLLAQIIQKDPKPPRKVNSKIPVDLETICLKSLDKDPDRRYHTAGQMADDLRRYVNRFAILARRTGPVAKMWKWVMRNPALSAALVVILVCLAMGGGLVYRAQLAERRQMAEQANHEAELLEEKLRAALEKAILASRIEDFDGARQAIREAEKLGCSPGQVRMLQGQLELSQGRMKEAIDHLTQAVELLPESVAAWGMLAVAYNADGRMTDFGRALNEATRLTPITPEDYLFRGYAEGILDSSRGLQTLDEAVRKRPSVLAYLVHNDVLRLNVLNVPDLEKAKRAAEDVQAIKRQLPENLLVLSNSILVHATCYNVYGEFQQPALQQAALAEGIKDARALERYADSSRAVIARWMFLSEIGQEEAGLADLRKLCIDAKDTYATYYYGRYLYMHGDFEQAVKILKLKKGEASVDLTCTLPALAELPDGPARAYKLYQEVAARDLGDWDLFNSQLMLRLLGKKVKAIDVSLKFLRQPERFPAVRKEPFQLALEYCAGRRSAEDLIASMHGNRGDLSNAHLCVALTALSDGDRNRAREHLQLSVMTRNFEFMPYDISRMLLSRMEKDEKWPPWIERAE